MKKILDLKSISGEQFKGLVYSHWTIENNVCLILSVLANSIY